jgi:hypothetical protein
MQASVIAESKAGSIRASEIGDGLVGVFGTDNAYAIEKKIDELGYGVPQLDSDLNKLQKEIHTMVSSFTELQ